METSKKNQIGCGLGAKFGLNYVQCCEKSKETGNIRFFSYFTWDYLLKQEAVFAKPPDWKFMAIIARNAKFYIKMLGPIFCPIWVKNGKKTDN